MWNVEESVLWTRFRLRASAGLERWRAGHDRAEPVPLSGVPKREGTHIPESGSEP